VPSIRFTVGSWAVSWFLVDGMQLRDACSGDAVAAASMVDLTILRWRLWTVDACV
jgi:hypothetical protein